MRIGQEGITPPELANPGRRALPSVMPVRQAIPVPRNDGTPCQPTLALAPMELHCWYLKSGSQLWTRSIGALIPEHTATQASAR